MNPISFEIEPTNACNARCTFCPRARTGQLGRLDLNLLPAIISRILEMPSKPNVYLCGSGEPLLHPQIASIVEAITVTGLPARLTTNASRLTRQMAQALLDAGLNQIAISASGLGSEYTRIHGLPFERLVENVRGFLELSKGRCDAIVSVVLSPRDKPPLDEIAEFWHGMGIIKIHRIVYNNRAGSVSTHPVLAKPQKLRRDAEKLIKSHDLSAQCDIPFRCICTGHDAKFYPCCMDWERKYPLADVAAASVSDVTEMKLQQLGTNHPLCRLCNQDPTNSVRIALASGSTRRVDSALRCLKNRQTKLALLHKPLVR